MRTKTFQFSTKKRIRLIAFGLLITLFSCAMLYTVLLSGKIIHTLAFSALALTGIVMVFVQLSRLWYKKQVGLELDPEGFYFDATSLGKKIGKIRWQDVQSIQTGSVYGSSQLFVKLTRAEPYLSKIKDPQQREIILESGFPLHADTLNATFNEMESDVMQYYHQYHSS